jgi:hypothetical protein
LTRLPVVAALGLAATIFILVRAWQFAARNRDRVLYLLDARQNGIVDEKSLRTVLDSTLESIASELRGTGEVVLLLLLVLISVLAGR